MFLFVAFKPWTIIVCMQIRNISMPIRSKTYVQKQALIVYIHLKHITEAIYVQIPFRMKYRMTPHGVFLVLQFSHKGQCNSCIQKTYGMHRLKKSLALSHSLQLSSDNSSSIVCAVYCCNCIKSHFLCYNVNRHFPVGSTNHIKVTVRNMIRASHLTTYCMVYKLLEQDLVPSIGDAKQVSDQNVALYSRIISVRLCVIIIVNAIHGQNSSQISCIKLL